MTTTNPDTSSPKRGDERLLVARAANGDAEAVERLYKLYEARLFTFCHRVMGSRPDGADATQEAFANAIWHLPGTGEGEIDFNTSLFIAANAACFDLLDEPSREIAAQKNLALDANMDLSRKQRAVLALREIAKFDYGQIADAMSIDGSVVARLILRARLNYAKHLRAEQRRRTGIEIQPDDETVHDATDIYRAIPPAVAPAALYGSATAKANEMLSQRLRGPEPEPVADRAARVPATEAVVTRAKSLVHDLRHGRLTSRAALAGFGHGARSTVRSFANVWSSPRAAFDDLRRRPLAPVVASSALAALASLLIVSGLGDAVVKQARIIVTPAVRTIQPAASPPAKRDKESPVAQGARAVGFPVLGVLTPRDFIIPRRGTPLADRGPQHIKRGAPRKKSGPRSKRNGGGSILLPVPAVPQSSEPQPSNGQPDGHPQDPSPSDKPNKPEHDPPDQPPDPKPDPPPDSNPDPPPDPVPDPPPVEPPVCIGLPGCIPPY
ncbi:MAG TPA: hypothetical protein VGO97_04100 [Solirubrobacterales bacterium]|nr:hypothetical protein [Solirubrobacterales bacterium]